MRDDWLLEEESMDTRFCQRFAAQLLVLDDTIEAEYELNKKAVGIEMATKIRMHRERLHQVIAAMIPNLAAGAVVKVWADAFTMLQPNDKWEYVPRPGAPSRSDGRAVTIDNFSDWIREVRPSYFVR